MGGAFRRSCRNNRIKHITTHRPGSSLTQIQQYADAVLGRLNREDIETEITKSHDYKMLRAYALIPLDESDTRDAHRRYEVIMRIMGETLQMSSPQRTHIRKMTNITNGEGRHNYNTLSRNT